ncbi:MAG: amino acid ABC transporter substrate-binding protein [Confluentimicrobium sp.]|nr:amino acid ABC transporter substrate-binding protein [Actibacterium sp.]MBF53733.1 amino acid ABC transporter substrate-binding protein [Actibacterium sp.]OWU70853.1 amino acid ABC transporter substrate-binding protein [Roseovarius sp. 22II1-1F6A]
MTFKITTLVSSLVLGLAASGAAADTAAEMVPADIKEKGYLSVGIESTYPPMAFRNPETNERAGINVMLVDALGEVLGLEIRYEDMGFEQLMTSVASGRIDMIGTAISDLPSRRETMSFVDYLSTGAQPFGLVATASELSDTADLCGHAVGAPRTTSYLPSLEAWNEENCIGADLEAMNVLGTGGATDTRLSLMQGRLDAGLLGQEYVAYLMAQEPDTFGTIGEPITRTLFGFAFGTEYTELRDAVAQGVTEIMENGAYTAALEAFGMEAQALTEVSIDQGT